MAALVGLLASGCAARELPASSQGLIVAAPASLRAPFEAIAQAFKARHPEAGATLMFGSADQLAATNAPIDVLATDSADGLRPFADKLAPGERRDFASNPLCLVVRAGSPELRLKTVPVTAWARRMVIADSRGEGAGAASEAALGRAGIRRAVDPKLAYVGTVKQALEQLVAGQADVTLAFASDLTAAPDPAALQIAEWVVDDPHLRYPITILAGTPRLAAARAFLDEVLHGDGPKLLAAQGLLAPNAPTTSER